MRRGVLVFFLLLAWLAWASPREESEETSQESGDNSVVERNGANRSSTSKMGGPFAQDCGEFCSLSYPEHTYPEPSHFQACTGGCRAAQLDAFIAWPGKPNPKTCTQSCEEVYTTDEEQFACTTGCDTPTVHTTFPRRSHLYKVDTPGSEDQLEQQMDSLIGQIWASMIAQVDIFSSKSVVEFDNLNDHAIELEMVVIPYRQFDVTILADDEVYSFHHYDIDRKVVQKEGSDSVWMSYKEKHRSCVWFQHRLVATKFLAFLSVTLAILGLVLCCSSMVATDHKKRRPTVTQPVQPLPAVKKAPYDSGIKYVQLGPLKHEKVSMI